MTVQEIREVLNKRPDMVDFLTLVLKDPDLIPHIPELTKLIQEGEGKSVENEAKKKNEAAEQ